MRVRSVARGARSALSRLWKKSSGAEGTETSLGRTAPYVIVKSPAIRDWSTASLLGGAANEAVKFGVQLGPVAASLTGVGSFGLGAYSIARFVKETQKKNLKGQIEAGHGIAWSLQGLSAVARLARPEWGLRTAGVAAGVVGGVAQAGIGAWRLVTGIRDKIRPRIVLGAIDLGAGLSWVGATLSGNPYALAAFIGLTAARMLYNYREPLTKAAKRLFNRVRGKPTVESSSSEPPRVIVTAPTNDAVADRVARDPGNATVRRNQDGSRAVVTPAEVRTPDGQSHSAVVVTPVE